jgi:hypothetical protein
MDLLIEDINYPEDTVYIREALISVETNRDTSCSYSSSDGSGVLSGDGNVKSGNVSFESSGNKSVTVSCADDCGNVVSESFNIMVDIDVPELLRLYKASNSFYMLLSKTAECEYDNDDSDFVFGEGIEMVSGNGLEHRASLGEEVYYIQCMDPIDNKISFTIYPG